jgi:Tat protein secretion system quality control protein TatD with DNase activity
LSPCGLALALPVSIHWREAWDDLLATLRDDARAG